MKQIIFAKSKTECCVFHPSAAVWLVQKILPIHLPYVRRQFGCLEVSHRDKKDAVSSPTRARLLPEIHSTAETEFFFSYFFLFSGLKEMQEKILGRSSRKYVQDFQLGKRKNNNALHLGSTWRNLFTPKINLFLCPETILGFFFWYIFLPVHCSQFLNLKKYFETKVKIFLKKILTGIALAFPVSKYFICKSTSVWMFSKTTSFLDEIISWNGHRFINCLESLSELHISIST